MNILITSIVDPKRSTYSRMHAFARHLSGSNRITILSVNDSWKASQSSSVKFEEEYAKSMVGIETVYITEEKKSLVSQELFSKRYLKKFLRQHGPFDIILDYNTLSIGRRAQEMIGNIDRIYDLADDLVDMIRTSPQLPRFISPFAARYAQRLVNKSIAEAQVVTGTTSPLLDLYGVPAGKKRVIPNGIPISFLKKPVKSEVVDTRKDAGEFLIGYVGVLREWVNFAPVFDAIKSMRSRMPMRLIIIGEEGDKGKVTAQAETKGVMDQVTMLGTIPHEKIKNYLAACDCGIVPFSTGKTSDFALPLKVFEYFSSGLPVVTSPIRSIKENFSDAVWFYENSEQLIRAIEEIHSDKEAAKSKVTIGMKRVEGEYTWDSLLLALDDLIENTMQARTRGQK